MKILSCSVKNFASYKELNFEFDNQGLSLIAGPTGSGKSTLCDVVPWVLFGITAKGGAVDEIISWTADGPTEGRAIIELSNQDSLWITRKRGNKANDLCFYINGVWEHPKRGKDIADTQRLINNLLGLTAELYLSGAYFHEFSAASTFFIANAKLRRQITEQMVDLTLAKSLTERSSEYKKSIKLELTEIKNNLKSKQDKIRYLNDALNDAETRKDLWETEQKRKIDKTIKLYEAFETEKENQIKEAIEMHHDLVTEYRGNIEALEKQLKSDEYFHDKQQGIDKAASLCSDEKCPTCGTTKSNNSRLVLSRKQQELDREINDNNFLKRDIANIQRQLDKQLDPKGHVFRNIDELKRRTNAYGDQVKQFKAEKNPHLSTIATTTQSIDETILEISSLEKDLEDFQVELSDVELLADVIAAFRAELIKNAVIDLQTNTNDLLTKHFDSEIRVNFDIAEADKLEVTITKDGNTASYTQLSKGQRQLLKLCYGVSVMKSVANHHGINFNAIFLDEFADGLSEELKIKTYGLLQQLATEHASVFVVEHSSELKARFSKRYDVELINGESVIDEV